MPRLVLAVLLCLCGCLYLCACGGPPPELAALLPVGVPQVVPMAEQAPATFALELVTGDAVDLIVDQRQVDVALTLLDPHGETLLTVDHPIGRTGPETLCFVAPHPGRYSLRLETEATKARDASLLLRHQRPASAADRLCHQAAEAQLSARQALLSQDDPEAVFRLHRRAAELWHAADRPYEEAVTLYALGGYAEDAALEGGVAVAEEAFLDTLDRLDALGKPEPSLQAAVLVSLGSLRKKDGRFEEAEGVLQESLDLSRRERLPKAEAAALYEQGRVLWVRHEAPAAVRRYRQALEIWRREGNEWGQIVALQGLGASYNLMARAADGMGYLEESLERAEELESRRLVAESLLHLGTARLQLARDEPETVAAEVIAGLERAVGIYRDLRQPRNEIVALDRLAGTLRHVGDLPGAMESYRASLLLSEKLDAKRYRAYTVVNLGCALVEVGRPQEAGPYLDEALAFFTDDSGESMSRAHALACQARGLRAMASRSDQLQQAQLESARLLLREALEVVERVRSRAREIGASLDPSFVWQDYAELAAGVSLELFATSGDQALLREAFEIRDLARARGLVERLQAPAPSAEDGDPQLHEALAAARARLNRAGERHRRLAAQGAPPRELKSADNLIQDQSLAVREAEEALRQQERPSAASLELPALPPTTATAVQAALDDETVLLTYALGKEESWLFLLRRHSLEAHPLPPRARIDPIARRYWEALQAPGALSPNGQAVLDGQYLSKILLAPALESVASSGTSSTPVRRLVIVPEGMLAYLPFGVLPLPSAKPGTHLVDAYELAYLPSAASLGALRRRAGQRLASTSLKTSAALKNARAVALVDAVYGPRDSRVAPQLDAAGNSATANTRALLEDTPLPRLLHSRLEGEILEELIPPHRRQIFQSFEARRERLLTDDLQGVRLLHLGAHAEVDEDHPELSAILFSRLGRDGHPILGAVYLHEIASLSLDLDLAVLSGCRTALGRNVRGAALHGLARGFFLAGASRLVVSLWSVDDEATAQLMVHFYRALLQDSLPPAAALRQAQLQLRAQPRWQAPYYWAGFVLQGEWR